MIRVENISKSYKNGTQQICAVNNVEFNISNKEFVGIVGRSGSGKSTLLKMIGGILKPEAGKIKISDIDIYSLSDNELTNLRADRIGFIFQDFCLEELYTVYQNIEIVLMISRIPTKKRREIILDILKRVRMEKYADTAVFKLSGGEKQRVSIARAIVKKPDVILADEPCGNLDSENGEIIMKLLREIANGGTSVILVTHNLDDAKKTDRIIELKDGKVISDENIRLPSTSTTRDKN